MLESNSARVSPLAHYRKKAYLTRIIAESPLLGQSQDYKRLAQAIRRRELTTSLEILAAIGIEENLAIFILANLQSLGVAV